MQLEYAIKEEAHLIPERQVPEDLLDLLSPFKRKDYKWIVVVFDVVSGELDMSELWSSRVSANDGFYELDQATAELPLGVQPGGSIKSGGRGIAAYQVPIEPGTFSVPSWDLSQLEQEIVASAYSWLYRLNQEDITAISVTHGGKQRSYALQNSQWVFKEDGKDIPVLQVRWAGTPLLLAAPRATLSVGPRGADLSAYGLDPPETVLQVATKDGSVVEVHLGNATNNRQNIYARLAVDNGFGLAEVAKVWGDTVARLATEPPVP